ncbi:MAG: pyrroline-5-carboxylate reductase [Acidimicrobiales bacterium]|nr:pyrroline-5-carboxylate reductase [Acidimicrobiales bacterium]
MTRLQVVGGGKMGEALLGGLVADGWAAAGDLHVAEPDPARRDALLDAVPGLSVGADPVGGVDTLIAVKPDVVPAVCEALAGLGATRVLSIAAGVRLATFESILGAGVPVVRAMPNTPSLVGAGAAAIAPGAAAGPDDLDWAAGILSAVGTVQVVDESLLDAVTGLSGSGPAYVFLLAEALMDAGEAAGLPRDTAVALTEQTLLGAATLLRQSDDPPSTLRQNVTSKGGTTAAGLAVFEEGGFRDLVRDVVAAAAERSRELGGG